MVERVACSWSNSRWNGVDFTKHLYTCQLFLRYKREIFILGVLGFLKTTQSFSKIPEEVRSLPKMSKVFWRRPKSAEGEVIEKRLIHKIRDREEGIVIYSFYTRFSFLTWVWVNIFLEIVSIKMATTHIFQSGVRNWPASVSRREIEVFNPQAWDSRLRRESWQVYSMCCITKMPRNSFIIPFSPSQMTLHLDPDLTQEQRLSVGIPWFNTTCTSWDIVCYSS